MERKKVKAATIKINTITIVIPTEKPTETNVLIPAPNSAGDMFDCKKRIRLKKRTSLEKENCQEEAADIHLVRTQNFIRE